MFSVARGFNENVWNPRSDQWNPIKDFLPGREETWAAKRKVIGRSSKLFSYRFNWVSPGMIYPNASAPEKRPSTRSADGRRGAHFLFASSDYDNEYMMIDALLYAFERARRPPARLATCASECAVVTLVAVVSGVRP